MAHDDMLGKIGVGLLVLGMAACGGGTTNPTDTGGTDATSSDVPQDTGPTADQACASLAMALCTRVDTCSHVAVRLSYGDVATCTSRIQPICLTTLGAQGSTLTPGYAASCAMTLATATCAAVLGNGLDSVCPPTAGTGVAGTACAFGSQCASNFCNFAANALCGACAAAPTAGSTCTSDDQCGNAGLHCNGTVCVMPGVMGATCDATHPCGGTLVCGGGTCIMGGAAGATCDTAHPCDLLGSGVYCNPTANTCATVNFAAAGGMCGGTASSFTVCERSGRCNGTNPGTCGAAAADGASCDTAAGPNCMPPAICQTTGTGTAGVCQLRSGTTCH